MIYGSICSGIESVSVAWKPLGMKCAFMSEIDKFPCAVLKYHYPEIPLHGDFTTIQRGDYGAIDILVGGTPCQSFSVAGLRAGLDDPRGNLMLGFGALAQRLAPKWLVWENVPGVLSSNGGRDFGTFLGMLAQLGYGFAYRVLDAQFVRVQSHPRAVPQRRRRVFVVGYFGDWRPAAQVLFERASLQGYPPPRREAGERTSGSLSQSSRSSGGIGMSNQELFSQGGTGLTECFAIQGGGKTSQNSQGMGWNKEHSFTLNDVDRHGVAIVPVVSPAMKSRDSKGPSSDGDGDGDGLPLVCHSLRADGFDASEDGTGRGTPIIGFAWQKTGMSTTLDKSTTPAIAFTQNQRNEVREMEVAGAIPAIRRRDAKNETLCYSIMPMNSSKDYKARETEVAQPIMSAPVGGNQGGDYLVRAAGFLPGQGSAAKGIGFEEELGPTLRSGCDSYGLLKNMAVRRLTPRECERLQGFPDDWTLIPWRGKSAEQCPDGPRYKALGNAMAVNVMAWIGQRIVEVSHD